MIIGISGAGLGAYATWRVLTAPSEPNSVVVGLWNDLSKSKANPDFNADWLWLIYVYGEQIYNQNYLKLNQSTNHVDTRFHLIKSGWYRVHMNMLWTGLDDTTVYHLMVHKDGDSTTSIITPASAYYEDLSYRVNTEFYILSNGTNFYEFSCWCTTGDSFATPGGQLCIEYVGIY